MTTSDQGNSFEIAQLIDHYANAMDAIEQAKQKRSNKKFLEVLQTRDEIEKILSSGSELSREDQDKLFNLDNSLRKKAGVIARSIAQEREIAEYRYNLKPPESAWWWFLEPKWSRYDWVFNLLTVTFLVLTTTFATNTIKAFSIPQGFDILATLSTISQGAGVVLISGGTLTKEGNQIIKNILSTIKIPKIFPLGIPPYLHSELTCGVSLILLGGTWYLNSNLPKFGEYYYQQGQVFESQRKWSRAEEQYQRALEFLPDRPEIYLSLGKVYEQLGNLQEAEEQYELGKKTDDAEILNSLGRVMILQESEKVGWSSKITKEAGVAKLRQARIYLENAAIKAMGTRNESKKKPNKNPNDFICENDNAAKDFTKIQERLENIENPLLRKEIYINEGISYLAEVDFNKPKETTKADGDSALDKAQHAFLQAKCMEDILPTTPAGRKARAYYYISNFLESGITESQVKKQWISEAIVKEVGNRYDKAIMNSALKAAKSLKKN